MDRGDSSDDGVGAGVPGGSTNGLGAEGTRLTGGIDARAAAELKDLRIGSRELFLQATEQTRMAIAIVDPYKDDDPIVHCNSAFCALTGYDHEEVIGRNCRFLQGPGTNRETVRAIREALDREDVVVVDILNYRKDGTPFWNALHLGPIYDRQGKLAYFFGSQWDVSELFEERERSRRQRRVAEELQHRTRNLFAVMAAIVRLSARKAQSARDLADKIASRIQALGRAHEASIRPGLREAEATSLETLIGAVLEPYRTARESQIELVGEDLELPPSMVTPVGVALHELATNAMKYGALGYTEGQVHLDWEHDGDALEIHWIETVAGETLGGELPQPASGNGSGHRIVEGVLGSLGGTMETSMKDNRYSATLRLPLRVDA